MTLYAFKKGRLKFYIFRLQPDGAPITLDKAFYVSRSQNAAIEIEKAFPGYKVSIIG